MGDPHHDPESWLPTVPPTQSSVSDAQTQLNYVIPHRLEHLLAHYCAQTEVKPGPLVRRLITDYLKGEARPQLDMLNHPKGRRTSVYLPVRMLDALEEECVSLKTTKAALIARLLEEFLPPRVSIEGIAKVQIEVPTSIYTKIYERYGPGPSDEVIVEALCDLIQKTESKAVPAEMEA